MCALVYKIQIPFLGQVDARGTQKKKHLLPNRIS